MTIHQKTLKIQKNS